MYQALLTRRYLTSKIMPLLAALAVTLCVAMELIVWSVMGGFLKKFEESGRGLIGDVAISWPNTGFAHYDDLIRRLTAEKASVRGATPIIETAGLISLSNGRIETVLVKGVDGPSYDAVTSYRDSLWWKPLDAPIKKDTKGEDPRVNPEYRGRLERAFQEALTLTARPREAGEPERAAAVLGMEVVSKRYERGPGGFVRADRFFLPNERVTLSVMPLDRVGRTVDVVAQAFPVANEFSSGLYELDARSILVRLDALQKMLKMNEAQRIGDDAGALGPTVDPATGREVFSTPRVIGVEPARVTSVLVRAQDGVEADALREVCVRVYEEFAAAHDDVPAPELMKRMTSTWRDRNAMLISAIQKETILVMFIYGIISITSIFLVLAIFWAMVSEKTKDIGVLRAIGASRTGVAWVWLRYGLAIGIVGAILGGAAAQLIVTNINPIHDQIGATGRWLGAKFGQNWNWLIWDPQVYYFTEIPNRVEWLWKGVIVTLGGAIASVIGALVPAIKAARMDPVRALRFD